MNFVFASPLESVNDVDSLALKETARPQTVPQTRFGGRIYSETGHFSRKFSSRTRSKFITGSEKIRELFGNLAIEDRIIQQCGIALSSGQPILLYGPPGNGKTSVALRLAEVFTDEIYVPYAITVGGEIISVYDSHVHQRMNAIDASEEDKFIADQHEDYDPRWVPCRRPFVLAGGELTLDMLDLRYDETSRVYEAPLQMKALGGCFVVDDFGHQLVSPAKLLNRWTVPLESRIDHLRLVCCPRYRWQNQRSWVNLGHADWATEDIAGVECGGRG